jgi:hypothetical protein
MLWNADHKSLVASEAGQPRGDGDYLHSLDSVGAAPQGKLPLRSQEFFPFNTKLQNKNRYI